MGGSVEEAVVRAGADESVVGPAAVGPRAGRPSRRTFSDEYKRQVVAEYEAAPRGAKGAVLRREGLYDSHVLEWRAAIAAGTLGQARRGRPRGSTRSPEQARIAVLERENAKLRAELDAKNRVIAARDEALDVLGKGVAFLESLSSRNAR